MPFRYLGTTVPTPRTVEDLERTFPKLLLEYRDELRQRKRDKWLAKEDADERLARSVVVGGEEDADQD